MQRMLVIGGAAAVLCAAATVIDEASCAAEQSVIERRAGETLTAVELEEGETLHFQLKSGRTQVITLEETWARTLLTNLPTPKKGFHGGWSVYSFGCRVRIDGQPLTMIRHAPVQESFYEPYVVNGVRIWFDGVRKIGQLFNETHGACLPRKAARLALQDASLPICVEEELRPWYPNAGLRIDVYDSYNGDDVWMGPYQGADLHGGLDINMPIGTPLWAPIGFQEQFYFNSLAQGANNNRWRGIRRWNNGQRWVLQAHHMTRLLVPENHPVPQGTHYAEAAGILTGSQAHSHFVFKVGEEQEEVLLDPWILFWQVFENVKDRAASIRACIAPCEPAQTGDVIQFSSTGSRPGPAGNRLTYCWTFGDGGCSDDENPRYVYAQPGIYPVTLVVHDGAKSAACTQHVTVLGAPVTTPALVLTAPDEPAFRCRPASALDVYGADLTTPPHTLRFVARPRSSPRPESKIVEMRNNGGAELPKVTWRIEYQQGRGWAQIEHAGEGNAQSLTVRVDASKLTARHGVYRAVVSVECPETINAPQAFYVELTTPASSPASDIVVDNDDPHGCIARGDWLTPKFRAGWTPGCRGSHLISAGLPELGPSFVRFQPDLAVGRYAVSFAEETPFAITPQTPGARRFPVRVRHRGGTETIWVEPLQSRSIGTFDFHEGQSGYVQVETHEADGIVVADAMHFQRQE